MPLFYSRFAKWRFGSRISWKVLKWIICYENKKKYQFCVCCDDEMSDDEIYIWSIRRFVAKGRKNHLYSFMIQIDVHLNREIWLSKEIYIYIFTKCGKHIFLIAKLDYKKRQKGRSRGKYMYEIWWIYSISQHEGYKRPFLYSLHLYICLYV